jgi:hypothetical protein
LNFGRKTVFWLIVLIVLGGAFHVFDRRQETSRQARQAELRLLPFTADEVGEFWIENAGEGLHIRALRGSDGWQLVQPLSTRGDALAIDMLLGNIVGARKDALLFAQAEPAKLAELGLDARATEMGLRTAAGETVLVLGERGPTHNVAYLMFKGRPEVYRIHADLRREATREVFALRDKTLVDFDPLALRRLEIARQGAPAVVVEHEQGRWNLVEPLPGRASMAKVLELLYALKNGQVKAFVDEAPAALAPYGLDAPMLRLTIRAQQHDAVQVLAIGAKDRARRGYFARSNQRPQVFDVEEDLVNTILLGMENLAEEAPAPR